MKPIFISLLMVLPLAAGYTKSISVTIDHTKVSTSNHTDFPILICANGVASSICDSAAHTNLAVPELKTVANGGSVTSSSGYDVGFASDITCLSMLTYELVTSTYVGTTGFGEWHVKIGTLSTSVDNVFYLCIGNAAITTDQSSTSTWNTAYKAIWHFGNGTTLGVNDSTSNANNGASIANMQSEVGQIDGAAGPSGVNFPTTFTFGTSSTVQTQDITISLWAALDFGNNQMYVAKSDDITVAGWEFSNRSGTNKLGWAYHDGGGVHGFYESTGTIPNDSTWHYLVMTWTSGTVKFYIDGSLVDTIATASGTINYSSDVLRVGNQSQNSPLNGKADEVRIANVVMTAGWILTEYNNQSSPSSFYTFGAAVAVGAVRHRAVSQ